MALSEQDKKLTYEAGIAGGLTPEKASSTSGYVITPDVLQTPQKPIQLPEEQTPTIPSIEGDMAYFKNLQKQSDEEKALQAQKDIGTQDLTNLLREYTGQGQEKLGLEQRIVNPIQTKIADITGQANVLKAEYNELAKAYEAGKAKLEAESGAKGVTRQGVLQGQQGALDRQAATELNVKASEIGLLQAQALALQGKADLAQKQIDRAIDLKYKGIEQEIEIKKFQLDSIKESLTAEETKRAKALEYALGKEEERIKDEKQNDKDINSMIINASSVAPENILNNAQKIADNGGTASDVSRALGKYGGDYYKNELLKEQIATERKERGLLGTEVKPPTAAQSTAAGFASRVVQSKDIIDLNSSELSRLSVVEHAAQRTLPNALKSPLMQKQEQAERNFVNAVLRRESGAAISPEEFKSAEKQYFPRPGDSDEVLAQKKANRDLTSRNLINESGTAYQTPQTQNLFSTALGKSSEIIPGTTIINSISPDGGINFNLPK